MFWLERAPGPGPGQRRTPQMPEAPRILSIACDFLYADGRGRSCLSLVFPPFSPPRLLFLPKMLVWQSTAILFRECGNGHFWADFAMSHAYCPGALFFLRKCSIFGMCAGENIDHWGRGNSARRRSVDFTCNLVGGVGFPSEMQFFVKSFGSEARQASRF